MKFVVVVVVVVVEIYVPNLYDFVEEFLELNLIVDHKHVQVFGLKAKRTRRYKNRTLNRSVYFFSAFCTTHIFYKGQ